MELRNGKVKNHQDLMQIKEEYNQKQNQFETTILVCGGAGCISCSCKEVVDQLETSITKWNLKNKVQVLVTGCMGLCAAGPVLLVQPEGVFYTLMNRDKVETMVENHLINHRICEEMTYYDSTSQNYLPYLNQIPFFQEQVRIALRNCGQMEYASLEAYVARDGYFGIEKVLKNMSRQQVVDEVIESKLRGRGGAGFMTGIKWEAGKNANSLDGIKYMVCNADEGDPGAFMDRSILEGDPHSVIEGMLIGAYGIGASKGYVYVRAEYPIAISRLSVAMDQAREAGLLGNHLFGSEFSFDLEIRIGAGAFVCGEETALLASIEGQRGEPKQKPPYPFEKGLFQRPTIINNVETLANIPAIFLNGAQWYAGFGTSKSKGTKVFALAGAIVNAGIIEVPMGTLLGDIIYKIGAGIVDHKQFKAIQSGGPSGGCLTKEHLNVSMDYESLGELGAIMGSGGLIVMNEDTCMVDTARYFMDFIREESCGKCLPCRNGTKYMLEILERITEGKGKEGDIELLEELSQTIKQTAMCGLGQTAPNPILSTLRYFRHEYEAHIYEKHCESGVCAQLQESPCRNACPANVYIPGYLSLLAANRTKEAYELIRQDNPFPSVCGRVCTHPCETHCRRAQVDESLAICSIKRFIGDNTLREDYDLPLVTPKTSTKKRVAIIGSGPSGLTCAYYLAGMGHQVDVYEAEEIAGGVLYWGIPEYRLPKNVLAKEIHSIERSGVKIHLNTTIGKDIDFDTLKAETDAIYIAIGTQVSRLVDVKGEELKGVESGLAFLKRVGLEKDKKVPKRLVVVGGGSTAMDVARTAIRLGSTEVTIVYRRTEDEMPAGKEEINEAREEGIRLLTMVSPVEFLGNDSVTGIRLVKRIQTNYGKDGRRKTIHVEGSEFDLACDGIITAINQDVDHQFYKTTKVDVDKRGNLEINKFTSQTSTKGIFAGGDTSPWGANIVITAIADGKKAAVNIDRYLGGEGEINKGREINIPDVFDIEVTEPHMRFPIRILAPIDRKDNFKEVSLGFHKLDAVGEAYRCLHCERR